MNRDRQCGRFDIRLVFVVWAFVLGGWAFWLVFLHDATPRARVFYEIEVKLGDGSVALNGRVQPASSEGREPHSPDGVVEFKVHRPIAENHDGSLVLGSGFAVGFGSRIFPQILDKGDPEDLGGQASFRLPAGFKVAALIGNELLFPAVVERQARFPVMTLSSLRNSISYFGPLTLLQGTEAVSAERLALAMSGATLTRVKETAGRLLAQLGEIGGAGLPPSDATFLIVPQPAEGGLIPTVRTPRDQVLPLSPESPLSWERLAQAVMVRRLASFCSSEPSIEWLVHAVAARAAVSAVGRTLGNSDDQRWIELYSQYVFLAPYRSTTPLDRLEQAEGKDFQFLTEIKGPLFLRAMECAEEEVNSSVVDLEQWLAVLGSARDGNDLEAAIELNVGTSAARTYRELIVQGRELRHFREAEPLVLSETPNTPIEDGTATQPFSLILTADTENFLETCGCILRQAGGIARRAWWIQQERARAPSLALDLGNLTPRIQRANMDQIARNETLLHVRLAQKMGYAGLALGPNELYHGADLLHWLQKESDARFQSCNVNGGSENDPWESASRVVQLGEVGVRLVGVTAVTPYWIAREEFERRTASASIVDPLLGLKRALEACPDRDELLIVYGQIPTWTVPRILREFPDIDLLVSNDMRALPDTQGPGGTNLLLRSGYLGDTLVILANEKSHGLSVFRLQRTDGNRVVSFEEEEVLLDPDTPEDLAIRQDLDEFFAAIVDEGSLAQVKTIFADRKLELSLLDQENGYVGAEACRSCHETAYTNWSVTRHARAFRTLSRKHRDHSPKCISCHVVGYGQPSGFTWKDPERARSLQGVQCEVCHGPGAAHVEDPGDPSLIRSTIGLDDCAACHDAEHSLPLAPRASQAWPIGAHQLPPPTRPIR